MGREGHAGPVMIHSNGTVRYVNDVFCDLVGVDAPATVAGKSTAEFVAAPSREQPADGFGRLRRDDTKVSGAAFALERAGGSRPERTRRPGGS